MTPLRGGWAGAIALLAVAAGIVWVFWARPERDENVALRIVLEVPGASFVVGEKDAVPDRLAFDFPEGISVVEGPVTETEMTPTLAQDWLDRCRLEATFVSTTTTYYSVRSMDGPPATLAQNVQEFLVRTQDGVVESAIFIAACFPDGVWRGSIVGIPGEARPLRIAVDRVPSLLDRATGAPVTRVTISPRPEAQEE